MKITENLGSILVLSQPGVSHDGSKDGGQVTEGHKCVINGGGEVIIPEQEVLEVEHQDRCRTPSESARQHSHRL